MHQLFETLGSPTPPPPSGMSGVMQGLSLHTHSIFVPRQAGDVLEITVLSSQTRE